MKPLHAAALTLIGWYLVVPPVEQGQVKNDAPLSRWNIYAPTETLSDCQHSLILETKHRERDWLEHETVLSAPPVRVEQILNGQCIASDDPRLKEK